ncbi:hypothetical protein GCM10020219_042270 [Nonomuraea dietziae]
MPERRTRSFMYSRWLKLAPVAIALCLVVRKVVLAGSVPAQESTSTSDPYTRVRPSQVEPSSFQAGTAAADRGCPPDAPGAHSLTAPLPQIMDDRGRPRRAGRAGSADPPVGYGVVGKARVADERVHITPAETRRPTSNR